MANLDPTAIAQRWSSGMAGAGDKIAQGVDAVTTAPGQAAAAQKALYQSQVAANTDKWARRTAAVPLQSWQAAMKEKGVPRIATGASAAEPKFATFLGKFLPFVDNARRSLPKRGTFEQNKQRAVAMMDALHKFQNT